MVESSIEYLRGMQVVKAFKQEGVSIAGIRKAYNDSKKINIKIEAVSYTHLDVYKRQLLDRFLYLLGGRSL